MKEECASWDQQCIAALCRLQGLLLPRAAYGALLEGAVELQ